LAIHLGEIFMRASSLVIAFSLAAAVNGAAIAGAVEWPQFRFDNKHDGVNKFEKVLNRKNVL
jgi:hypothetical protein